MDRFIKSNAGYLIVLAFGFGLLGGWALTKTPTPLARSGPPYDAQVWGMVGGGQPRTCSIDGSNWWPARDDGMCYAADNPGR